MAISTNYAFSVAVKQMQDVQAKITKTQSQLATGEMTASASDNPDATASIQRLQTAITRQASYSKTLTQADNRLATQETSISGASDALIRIKELSIQSSNDTLSAQDRSNIAIEIHSLREQLLSLANARDESGNYVFGGARTGSRPFAADAGGAIRYAGDQDQVSVAIGEQREIAVGGVGSRLFSTVVRTVDERQVGIGFFQALDDLAQAVAAGDDNNIQRGLGEVDAMQEGISGGLAEIGSARNSIDEQKTIVDATSLRLQATLSGIKDTDYTVAATDLQKQMLALQAAQSTFAQTAKMSLFDYIK